MNQHNIQFPTDEELSLVERHYKKATLAQTTLVLLWMVIVAISEQSPLAYAILAGTIWFFYRETENLRRVYVVAEAKKNSMT